MLERIRNRFTIEEGATAVEYGIMVALIAAVIIGLVLIVGQQTCEGFATVSNEIDSGNAVTTPGSACP